MKLKKVIHSSQGFTLIEIMITMIIIGLIMGIGVTVLFPGREAKMRDTAGRLAGTIKFLYNEAAVKDRYYRIVFDFDKRTYSVESREEPFFLGLHTEDTPLKKPSTPTPETQEGTPEAEGGEAFTPEEGYLLKPTQLSNGIKFKDIFVMHQKDKIEQGKVEGYVFPQGWVEPMVINLSDEDEEIFYSLEVNPLTGTSRIRSEYFEVKPETYFPEEPN